MLTIHVHGGPRDDLRESFELAEDSAVQLGGYQRVGFRMARIERDAFTPATGYPSPIDVDGLLLRDRVWFDRDL
jgi:hypothetical protein